MQIYILQPYTIRMIRKVVKQGSGTLVVSLPANWTRQVDLKKGDDVLIEVHNGRVIISKDLQPKKRHTIIQLRHQSESAIRTTVVNAYRAGFDSIEIRFAPDSHEVQYTCIASAIKNYTIGFEFTKRDSKLCILENITEPASEQFDVLLRKLFFNISLLIDGTQNRLRETSKFAEYADITLKIHQFDNFCRRVLSKYRPGESNNPLLWTFLGIIVHGQRELYHLNRFLDKNPTQCKDTHLLDKLRTIFNLLVDGYIKKDIATLEQLHTLEKSAIYSDAYKLLQKHTGNSSIVTYHTASAIKHFYLASSPLMGALMIENMDQAPNI